MQQSFLSTPIEFLKGVGPIRAELLRKEAAIATFGDLLTTFPFRYVDRSKRSTIREIREDLPIVQICGTIIKTEMAGGGRNRRLVATLRDQTGELELVWFKGHHWLSETILPGKSLIVFGKPNRFGAKWTIAHPELEFPGDPENPVSPTGWQPFYSTTEKLKAKGLDSRGISRLLKTLLSHESYGVPETLPANLLQSLQLMPRAEAFRQIHIPSSGESLRKARYRLTFEEFFYIQLRLLQVRSVRLRKQPGHPFRHVGDRVHQFYHHHLTFELTNAQKRVIREIRADLGSGRQMNRLLQGDVGSGKTMVALMSMLIALDNGFQACLMAPTEILASQHHSTLSTMLANMDLPVALLTGSTRTADRREIHQGLQTGTIPMIVGTHALLEEEVKFQNLGLAVIDEQHRFGVAQRARLWAKNPVAPHILVMTATPIPRTLAMTLYGDLDTSIIDELPPGRKPVITHHAYESRRLRLFGFIREKIREGRQVYMVYPLIQESESLDLKNLMEGYDAVVREFPLPEYAVSIVHGKMKASDKDYELQRFIRKETQILVATTVIEVGVDIPNASVMVIENAERFGLSQLHQLRGRVGRGADQAYCILMTSDKLSSDARQRIQTMVETTDGFRIAEADLKLRGPGDMEGTRQSGILDLKIADVVKDEKILKMARTLAARILEEDPDLELPPNHPLAIHLQVLKKCETNWGLIS